MLCWWLKCQHSCQYFVWTLILFSISFSVTSFFISIFLSNNFILYYCCCCVDDCNADTHANIQYSCTVHWLWLYTWSARALTSVHSLYSINFVHRRHGSDQSEAKKIRHTQWHTQWHIHGHIGALYIDFISYYCVRWPTFLMEKQRQLLGRKLQMKLEFKYTTNTKVS